ncbi:MAG: N-acetyltransferase [Firmicutes bacterium]|nr:N-acetyltransferase [Bacillota bacterium]
MSFRKAKMPDVEALHKLINELAEQGLMLPRSRSVLYESLREFTIIENDGKFIGGGALHIIWEDLAEVRALAIKPEFHGKGIGKELIKELTNEAKELGIPQIFALTYQVEFFKKCGFEEIVKEKMPQKVWKDCINCPKFPNCDEVAMIRAVN